MMSRRCLLSLAVHFAGIAALVSGTADLSLAQVAGKERPEPALLKVEPLPPELLKVLEQWEAATKGIQRLDGEHQRWVYDMVFQVEKRSKGSFYYEAPDKGRIDFDAVKVKPKEVNKNKRDRSGKQVELTVESDQPMKWICDGTQIIQVDVENKTYESMEIPPGDRGANIMNGPLPFLFGMPPDAAQKRYELSFAAPLKQTLAQNQVWLSVKPRLRKDAANYESAQVILDSNSFLPVAVQLIQPGGDQESVYTFNIKPPKKGIGFLKNIFGEDDPFKPQLTGYKRVMKKVQVGPGLAPQGINPAAIKQQVLVPNLVGLHWKKAQTELETRGLKAEFLKGKLATDAEQIYAVYLQQPVAQSQANPGDVVKLLLYTSAETSQK